MTNKTITNRVTYQNTQLTQAQLRVNHIKARIQKLKAAMKLVKNGNICNHSS
jgi:hypothetical protein